MDFVGTKRARVADAGAGAAAAVAPTAHGLLSLYSRPPTGALSVEQFERYGLDRIQLFRDVDAFRANGALSDLPARVAFLDRQFLADEQEPDLYQYHAIGKGAAGPPQDKDTLSHFVMRLAFCRRDDLRRWMLQHECQLFRVRLENSSPDEVDRFLAANGLNYERCPTDEYLELKEDLDAVAGESGSGGVYFKVDFEQALDLVAKRRVLLKDGKAYVPRQGLIAVVVAHFRSTLSKALAETQHALPDLADDDRLVPMLNSLTKEYSLPELKSTELKNGMRVTADQVNELSETSFPMCMRHLHKALRENHHLKHGGRLQYGLFLKGIGLSLEDSLAFWRNEFVKKMPADKFDKEHAYTLRYFYGKEGKGIDWSPMGCVKIIGSAVSAGDHHGCPYRHFGEAELRKELDSLKIGQHAPEIIELTKGHEYQLACKRVFEITHKEKVLEPVSNHPNTYFSESIKRRMEKGEQGDK